MDTASFKTRRDCISATLHRLNNLQGIDLLAAFAAEVTLNDGDYDVLLEADNGIEKVAFEVSLHGIAVLAFSDLEAITLWQEKANGEIRNLTVTLASIDRNLNGIEPIPDHSP